MLIAPVIDELDAIDIPRNHHTITVAFIDPAINGILAEVLFDITKEHFQGGSRIPWTVNTDLPDGNQLEHQGMIVCFSGDCFQDAQLIIVK